MTSIERKLSIAEYFPWRLREVVRNALSDDRTEEIRVRAQKPIQIVQSTTDEICTKYLPSVSECRQLYEAFCQHSVYSCEEDAKRGFITLPDRGIRVGISGNVLVKNAEPVRFTEVTGFCIRIPHERVGCSKRLCQLTDGLYGGSILIASSPGIGKTTLLRDMARELSDEYARKVCIIDERSELAGCSAGIPSFNIGLRTDVIDNCPKSEGMVMAIRSLSPNVIITDELGKKEDFDAVYRAINSGISVAASMHSANMDELSSDELSKRLSGNVRYTAFLCKRGGNRSCILFDKKTVKKEEFVF